MSANPAMVWKTVHSLDGKYMDRCSNEALAVGSDAFVDDKGKANAFAETYKSHSADYHPGKVIET